MDSLQGIPVEYKLDTFNNPCTGTTLCHPKIGYVNATLLFCKRQLALNSPLGHFNGDQCTPSPQVTRHTKLHGDSKVQSLTRPMTHAAISTFSTLFIKTPFDYRHLTSSSPFYFSQPSEGITTLSEETTQRKHTYVTPSPLLNNKLSLATNKPTSPAKISG